MRRLTIKIPDDQKIQVIILLKEGIKRPKNVTGETLTRLSFVDSFLVQNIEALSHTLGGNYDELPVTINQVRWGIIDGGYTDEEVYNEVNQTLKGASGDPVVKKQLSQHISELLLPLAG